MGKPQLRHVRSSIRIVLASNFAQALGGGPGVHLQSMRPQRLQ